jgi:hypothetical protein
MYTNAGIQESYEFGRERKIKKIHRARAICKDPCMRRFHAGSWMTRPPILVVTETLSHCNKFVSHVIYMVV